MGFFEQAMIKKLLQRAGLRCFGPGSVPKGVDLFHDINRFGYGKHVRTVVDIGANVGDFANAARRAFSVERMICVEPSAGNFGLLARGAGPEVECIHAAAGSEAGTARLYLHEDRNTFHSTTLIGQGKGAFEEIRVTTVDEIALRNFPGGIDLLKTDTEGGDLDVLRGAENIFSRHGVFLVVSEVGFDVSDRRHSHWNGVWELLTHHGFGLVGFYDQGFFGGWSRLDFANALFINKTLAAERLGDLS